MKAQQFKYGVVIMITAAVLCVGTVWSQPKDSPATESLQGLWVGAVTLPGTALHIEVTFTQNAPGAWSGAIDIPQQGAKGVALSDVQWSGRSVAFTIPVPNAPGLFKGTLTSGEIRGDLAQRGQTFPFSLKRKSAEATTTPPTAAPATSSELSEKEGQDLLGPWNGAIKITGFELHLDAVFSAQAGQVVGTLDVPQQGVKKLPLHSIRRKGPAIHFEISIPAGGATLNATFDGALSGDTITGTYVQAGKPIPFYLNRGLAKKAAAVDLPYTAEDVKYPNGSITLAGTLTHPKDTKNPPAVILITGSGPQNRDEFVLGMEPFRIIADYLSRRGIAVLRFDDRGVGDSTGDFWSATSLDFATDVEAGIAYLKTRRDIAFQRIGLLGHSEGGLIAPIVAARHPDVAFIVLMAGPGENGLKILQDQSARIARAHGVGDAQIQANHALLGKIQKLLSEGRGLSALRPEILAMGKQQIAVFSDEPAQPAETAAGNMEALADLQIKQLESPWFRFFLTYEPAESLRKVKCPVLAVNGSLDLQVPARSNLDAIRAALTEGRNPDFKTVDLPGLNHLFQRAKTGSPREYAKLPKEIDPSFLELVTGWIQDHTGLSRSK